MSPDPAERRAQAQAEIARHLEVHGAGNWTELRARYPEVDDRKFFRWVEAVRKRTGLARVSAGRPRRRRKPVEVLAELSRLYADAEQLREHATHPPRPGERRLRRIKSPTQFDSSIRRRMDVLAAAVKAMQELYALQDMRALYDLVVQEVAAESPDTARRILRRLAALEQGQGFRIDGGKAGRARAT